MHSGAQDYRPGNIVRIRLENFVTYDAAQYNPGPNLNMILGPNGTGKSTLVCAICLGLGGKPGLLGRAKELKEFVKHGKDKAVIEIELKGKGAHNLVVRRTFTKEENSSTWTLNGQKATLQAVLEKVKSLEVQVDNLIQFLPQDRVAEFAQMDSPEVLVETERATGGQEMLAQHEALVDLKKREKEMKTNFSGEKAEIEALEKKNANIEAEVKRYRERQKQEQTIELIKKKKPWLEYDDARSEFFRAKAKVEETTKFLAELQKENAPLRNLVKELEKKQAESEGDKKGLIAKYKKTYEKVEAKNGDIEKEENDFDDLTKRKLSIRKGANDRQKNIQRMEKEIEGYRDKLEESHQKRDTTALQRAMDEKSAILRNFANQISEIQQEIRSAKDDEKEMVNRIHQSQRKLEQLESVSNQRLQSLRNFQKDTYTAVLWLRANIAMFKKPVYEPIVLQINVRDKNFAQEIETAIPVQQLFTFVCEDKEDHHKFIKEVSQQQKLRINAITVPEQSLDSYRRPSREKLDEYRFNGVLLDYIDAPEAIKRCLCEFVRFHEIPVTKGPVNEELIVDKNVFSTFYAKGYSYRVTRSKYGNHVASTSTRPVKEARNLSVSVDVDKKESLLREMNSLRNEQASINAKIDQLMEREKAIRAEDEPVRRQKAELHQEIKKATDAEKALDVIKLRMEGKQRNLDALREEAAASNIEQEEASLDNKIRAKAIKRAALALDAMNLRHECYLIQKEKAMVSLGISVILNQKNQAKQEVDEKDAAHTKATQDLNEAKAVSDKSKQSAKRKLEEAKKAGEPLPELRVAFDALPKVLEELEAMLQVELRRLELTKGNSADVVKEFENREREIEEKKKELDKKITDLEKVKAELAEKENEWKPRVMKLVEEVSQSFGEFMKKLKCVGECKVAMDEDYAKWGIQILVKFRDNESLQVLTRDRQSGGERAVSTILYLMALQSLARSPFRVVDEINQGMDPQNERRVHSIIVNTATMENTSQYFLITPKLLPDLDYNERMKILCIFNGEWQPEGQQWSFDKYFNKLKASLSSQ